MSGLLADDRLLWFVNRGTGLVLLTLLTTSVLLGVLSTFRMSSRAWPRFLTQAVHRNVSLIAVVATLVHAGVAVLDGFVDLGWPDLVVPFVAGYRPLPTALGTLAFDLVLVLVVTSLLRHRLSLRAWRRVHGASYGAWGLGVAHGLLIGTDTGALWSVLITAVCVGTVIGAVVVRLAGARRPAAPDLVRAVR